MKDCRGETGKKDLSRNFQIGGESSNKIQCFIL